MCKKVFWVFGRGCLLVGWLVGGCNLDESSVRGELRDRELRLAALQILLHASSVGFHSREFYEFGSQDKI